ncbi:MAG: ORF6N domain-containing protein [Paludibacter sp.]|nr:ORF6N domain-containing protein [Paludibacter sp.]
MELQIIQNKILEVRGQYVMLDFDLAEMYQTETKILNQSVKRNAGRFPPDFMFQLTEKEFNFLRSQFVTSKKGGIRRPPYAFTELGVAMLSSVLRSPVAIEINIQIMRAFVELRKLIFGYEDLAQKIQQLEAETNLQFNDIYQALTELASQKEKEQKPFNPVGYLAYD